MSFNNPSVLGGSGTGIPSGSSGAVGGPASSTDNALVRYDGATGLLVQNGVLTEDDFTGTLNGPLNNATTTSAGVAFTNQPANDGVEVVSSNAGDTTQTVTIIGTTNGSNTVVVETVTLNGTTAVATVKTNWGLVLAVKKSATTLGTVTVREASADQTITAGLTAAVLSVGVNTVSTTGAYNRVLSMVGSGSTTKQIGLCGTDTTGAALYDSKALNGTTAVSSNSQFYTLTEVYTGDLEATRTATVTADGTLTINSGILALTGRKIGAANGASSAPAETLTGTWFSGGSATTTKPQFLLEPSGTTSTGWATGGTGIGVNAASGFAGSLLDLQTAGTMVFRVNEGGSFLGKSFIIARTSNGSEPGVNSYCVTTNEGASAQVQRTLPTASTGLVFEYIVQDTDGIRVIASTGDTIRIAGTVSSSAGYIENATIGSTVRLVAINATEWIATSVNGTWTFGP